MLILIKPNEYAQHREDLDAMYHLRHTVFFEKMKWQVTSHNEMEKDTFDENNTYYLLYKDEHGCVRGCIRFIEMIHPCMFDDHFKDTLPNAAAFKKKGYWETSRFAVDIDLNKDYTLDMCRNASKLILAGLMQFGLESHQVETYITLTYPSVKRLSHRNGLFIYDIATTMFQNETIEIWAFPPMLYSFHKLTQSLTTSTQKNITHLLTNHRPIHNAHPLHESCTTY